MKKNRKGNATIHLGQMEFEIIDSVKPSINGKSTYQRLLIRRIPPKEKVLSICELCGLWKTNSGKCQNCEVDVIVEKAQ
jgi:hypothetical protein